MLPCQVLAKSYRGSKLSLNCFIFSICFVYLIFTFLTGYNVPTCPAPKIGLQIYAWFDGTVKDILPSVNQELKFDNSKVRQISFYIVLP